MKYALLTALFGCLVVTLTAQTVPPPTQTDEIIIDNGTSGKADPADRIRYKVTIMNTGGSNANGAQLNVVPDPRTTFVPGSFRSSPLAVPDAYACTGNVGINVPAGSGLKVNDFDDALAGATITAGTFATAQSGSVMISADGSFMYTPPAGFTGSDMFTYTLNDGNPVGLPVPMTDMGTVTITVSDLIWFIDNSSGAATSDGRVTSPFKTLADFNAGSAAAAPVVYLEHTGTDYTGGIVLQNGERLFGEGHTGGANLANVLPFALAMHSKPLPAINGSNPVVRNTGGTAVSLASGNTLRGFDVGSSGTPQNGTGISGTGVGALVTTEISLFVGGASAGKGINLDGGGPIAIEMVQMNLVSCNPIAIDVNNVSSGTWVVPLTTISNAATTSMEITSSSVNFTLSTLNITNSGSHGIHLSACGGNFTVNGGAISNTGGVCVFISTGTVVFLSSASITKNSAGFAVDVDNHDSGNVTFQTGSISSTGASSGLRVQNCNGGTISFTNSSITLNTGANPAVTLSSNTGATMNFGSSGGLVINTSSGIGFSATGGGTVNVTGANNTINSTAATALNVASTTIGASGMTFLSISSAGAANGIVLSSTGASGGLSVTGTGSTNGSGGTIQNITNRGVSATSTISLSLKNMTFNNANTTDGGGCSASNASGCNAAIHLATVTNAVLDNVDITTTAQNGINVHETSGFQLLNSTLTGNGNGGTVEEAGVFGTNLFGTATISNTTVTFPSVRGAYFYIQDKVLSMTVSSSSFNDTQTSALGADGFEMTTNGTTNADVDITNCTFLRDKTNGVQFLTEGASQGTIDITGCTVDPEAGVGVGLEVASNGTSQLKFNIANNPVIKGRLTTILNCFAQGNSSMDGQVHNNVVTSYAGSGSGIRAVATAGTSNMRIKITNNTVSGINLDNGITCTANGGTGRMDATITGNNVTVLNTASFNIQVVAGASSSTFTNKACGNVANNIVSGAPIANYQARAATPSHEMLLQGGGATVVANWNANTNSPLSPPATVLQTGTGVFTFGATCLLPSYP